MEMEYTQEQIHEIVSAQREFFRTGETLDGKWRIRQLKKLKQYQSVQLSGSPDAWRSCGEYQRRKYGSN